MHFHRLKRRDFITLFGSTAATSPLAATAQHAEMPVIGVLHSGSRISSAREFQPLHQGGGFTRWPAHDSGL